MRKFLNKSILTCSRAGQPKISALDRSLTARVAIYCGRRSAPSILKTLPLRQPQYKLHSNQLGEYRIKFQQTQLDNCKSRNLPGSGTRNFDKPAMGKYLKTFLKIVACPTQAIIACIHHQAIVISREWTRTHGLLIERV